jgi:hypothetical protein
LFFDISVKSGHKAAVLLLRDGNGGLDDPALSVINALGLLPFLSFFILPSGYRGFGIKALITPPLIPADFGFALGAFVCVFTVNAGIKSHIMFEHPVNDGPPFFSFL